MQEPFSIEVIRQCLVGNDFGQAIADGKYGIFSSQVKVPGLAYLKVHPDASHKPHHHQQSPRSPGKQAYQGSDGGEEQKNSLFSTENDSRKDSMTL